MEWSASCRYLGWRAWAGGWADWERAAPFPGDATGNGQGVTTCLARGGLRAGC